MHTLPPAEVSATFVEVLRGRAAQTPHARAFVFLDEEECEVTYAQLDRAARRVAVALRAHAEPGERVLLLYPPGRAYVEGFLGCLYAGLVAVPAYPPDPMRLGRTLPRLRALVQDCGARVALSVSFITGMVEEFAQGAPELGRLQWLATDALDEGLEGGWTQPVLAPDSLAFLQYTSGSTGAPKGVMLSHANLLHNSALIRAGFDPSPDAVGVIWLPPYHDMGLIGGILQPLYAGLPTVLLSPLTFLQRPLVWLETLSRYRGTLSGGPNFAFDLCVRKSTPEERAALDLSRWEVAFCGAEPVREETLARFAEAFAPAGFRREAFYPCYGLAEATLIVTGGRRGAPLRRRVLSRAALEAGVAEDVAEGAVHVGCGGALGEQRLAVVDPATGARVPAGRVGELWVSGPSVAQGYWGKPEETQRTFGAVLDADARRYLRTGDLGFVDAAGELFVTGRQKDLIILRGRNVYPQDVEAAAERAHPGVRPGCSAAFGVTHGGEERVVLVAEFSSRTDSPEAASGAVRGALGEACEVAPLAVCLLKPGSLPKTSSGKVQRHAARRAFLAGELETLARWEEADGASALPTESLPAPAQRSAASLIPWLAGFLARRLGVEAPGPDVSLAQLGLDSLRAMEVQAALEAELGVRLGATALLRGPTVRELAEALAAAPAAARPEARTDAAGEVPATEGQRALWFVQRLAPESTAYSVARAAHIRSPLDGDALARALATLVSRQPSLRTTLPERAGVPVQHIAPAPAQPVLAREDAAGWSDAQVRARLDAEAARPFDLARGPLFRALLLTRAPDDAFLLLALHHSLTDFWSLTLMVEELLALYAGERQGRAPVLPEPVAPAAIAERLATACAGEEGERLGRYWQEALRGAPPALELPTTFPRPRLQSFRGASLSFRLSAQTAARARCLAQEEGTTLFTVLLTGYAALLQRYCGEEDVVVGTPTAGRGDPALTRALGYLVNPVPVRTRFAPDASLREAVRSVKGSVLGALDHAALPFARIVERVQPARDPGRSPLVQTVFALQRAPAGPAGLAAFAVEDAGTQVQLGELAVAPVALARTGAAFDLSLVMAETEGALSATFEYCADLFDAGTVRRMAGHLETLLGEALAAPERPLSAAPLLRPEEREQVVGAWSAGAPAAPPATLTEVFARTVAQHPEAPAAVFRGTRLTYAQLDAQAGALAALLQRAHGVQRGDVVGVCAERGLDAIVAFWGVLKAGAVLLPLEPALPRERLALLVEDARPRLVLTSRAVAERLPADGPPLLALESLPLEGAGAAADAGLRPDDAAYIIYTSGSTGRPKGVRVAHRGVANLAQAGLAPFGFGPGDRVLQHASSAFDASVYDVLCAHAHGAALYPTPPEAVLPGPELVRLLREEGITAVTLAPSVAAALPEAELPALRLLTLAGEAVSPELVARWAPGRRLINAYGPTEGSICASWDECRPDGGRPTIGRPVAGVRLFVLDAAGAPVPAGVPGELYLGGEGVALGYLGHPELTRERFVPSPFGEGTVYRTGDRVRWLPDGRLDFLGRVDDQVKVRGVRVELGEVEACLREVTGASQVAVAPRPGPGGALQLAAYLVAPAGAPRASPAELRARLRERLPEAYVPAAFVFLEALPLLPSGKTDRRVLPAPAPEHRGAGARVLPRSELERQVAEVWAEVLGHPEVGVREHFFDELGGSSLLVTRACSALAARLGREVPVTHLFEHPTVEALARRLSDAPAAGPAAPQPEERAEARRQALARRNRRPSR